MVFPQPSKGFVAGAAFFRASTSLLAENPDHTYHKGGNSKQTLKPVVKPALLGDNESEEECEDILIDFATGDELCWNEPPSHPKNVVLSVPNASKKKDDWVRRSFSCRCLTDTVVFANRASTSVLAIRQPEGVSSDISDAKGTIQ